MFEDTFIIPFIRSSETPTFKKRKVILRAGDKGTILKVMKAGLSEDYMVL